jgi:surface antigen
MPRPGEIAVYARGPGYDRASGHVAVVTAVTDTTYTVAEMNHDGPGVIDTRTIAWPDAHLEGFIP